MENNQQQNAARILDMDLFNSIPHGEIFGTGYCYEPRLYANTDPKDGSIIPTLLRWVAKKGGGNDWAVYYGLRNWPIEYICKAGDKSYTPDVIKSLVNCTDEVMQLYRK